MAEQHGNPQLAANLRRAAELTALGDDEVLAIYDALRPGRSTPAQLTELAASLAGRGLPLLRRAGHRGGRGVRTARPDPMSDTATTTAGERRGRVDIGNATTEVAVLSGGRLLGTGRLPTRGRKGSAESVHGAAALVRRAGAAARASRSPRPASPRCARCTPDAGRPGAAAAHRPAPGAGRGRGHPGRRGHAASAARSPWTPRAARARPPGRRTGRGSCWCRPGWATRRRLASCGGCSAPGCRSARCWPPGTRAC